MAIQWSGVSGHMQVGIDVRTSGYDTNTTVITVYVDYYIRIVNWRYNDNQTLNWNGHYASGAVNYLNSQGSTGTYEYLIYTYSFNQGISYSGGPTLTFQASVSGAYDGSAPYQAINWTVPARPPNVPTQPGIGVDSVTVNSARVVVTAPDPRGATIDAYQTQVASDAGFTAIVADFGGGTGTVTGLNPSTTYYARARAHNWVGWGAFSGTASFTTGATVPGVPTSFAASAVDQTTTNLTWVAPASNGGSAITTYDVQYATDSGFTQNLVTFSDPTSPANLTGLTPGTTYWARVRAVNGVGAGGWTTAVSFTTLAGTPTIVSPTAGSTRTDGIGNVTISALGIVAGRLITIQLSKDNTFATGLKTMTLTATGTSGNNQYTLTDPTVKLDNGTWYVRAKVTNTGTGYNTPWSTVVSFIQSHTPAASVQSPTASAVIQYAASIPFTWKFTDSAHPNDLQTSYRLVIENNGTGATIYDSNKTALATTVGNTFSTVQVAISDTLKNVTMRWRVMVWDRDDQASAWSGYGLFTLSDPPVVTVVTPPTGLPVDNGAPPISWTVAIPSGGSQAQALVQVFDSATNTMVWETTVVGAGTTVTPPVVILSNNKSWYVTVSITDTNGLTGNDTSTFSTEYDAPDTFAYTMDATAADNLGYIEIDWSTANADPLFASWKIYRRLVGSSEWELLTEIPNQNTRTYRDYMLTSGLSYSYSVTQTAMRSGTVLESSVGFYLDGTGVEQVEERVFTPMLTRYWIIDPDNLELSMELIGVTSDSSTLEFESETYNIIGRGRHRDYGDELGYSGTITCQIRTTENTSSFRLKMEALRRAQETYYLRTPFGRLFQIALGDLGWAPLPGTGSSEMGQMTIPYEQVA